MNDTIAERWDETCQLFHELCDLDAAGRLTRLTRVGSTDPELRGAVEALLAADELAGERLAPLKLGISDVLHRNLVEALPPTRDSLGLTGQNVSHFRIIEPLATGGMGVVYRAHDTRLNREVALKVPLAAQQLDSGGRARFLREAHAAGALDHPNLCSVYEVGESADGQPFLAMPLYSGESLRIRLAREGRLPLADVLSIGRQVASGLAFAHGAGVIHRDLKPGNIMLLPDGTAKILDFGLAKVGDINHTVSSAGMGTAGYMAPEQIRGRAVDARIDLWSLGVVMYEMLTGARPFRGDDVVSMSYAILHDDAPRPSTLRPEIERSVDELVTSLLQKEPGRRYTLAREVAFDLDSIQRGARPVFRRNAVQRASLWFRTRPLRQQLVFAMLAAVMTVSLSAAARRAGPFARAAPTQNAEAYRFYLRGRAYEESGPIASADTLYRRALTLDPGFALARARLAIVHLTYTLRPVQARLDQGRQEATEALRAQPGLADAHYALGLYWQRQDDHERALAQFAAAERGLRQSAALHGAMGTSYAGLGLWAEAVTAYGRALELDPRDIRYAPSLAITYGRLRRYRKSQNAWASYIALTPDAYVAMLIKGHSVIRSDGTADTLAAALRRIPADWDANGLRTFSRVAVARLQRRPHDAIAALAVSQRKVSEDAFIFRPHSLLRALAYNDAGDSTRARVHYDSARAMLQDSVAANPNDPRLHIALGMALAGLNRREHAIGAARKAMALAPLSANVVAATAFMGGAAEIFAYLGENDAAIQLLDRLLRLPAGREASVPLLKVDPAYDRLRSDPDFQKMLERHATN